MAPARPNLVNLAEHRPAPRLARLAGDVNGHWSARPDKPTLHAFEAPAASSQMLEDS